MHSTIGRDERVQILIGPLNGLEQTTQRLGIKGFGVLRLTELVPVRPFYCHRVKGPRFSTNHMLASPNRYIDLAFTNAVKQLSLFRGSRFLC